MLDAADVQRLEGCLAGGGVVLFPADTVYGLACDPDNEAAVVRLYELKGRPPARPAAVLFGSLVLALAALGEVAPAERAAMAALLPGPVTLLLPNRTRRYPLACGPDPDTIGVRVPRFDGATAALATLTSAVMQSSANPSGGPDARRLEDVDPVLRDGADLVLDGGERPGTASTVIDLREFAEDGAVDILREGAMPAEDVSRALSRGQNA
jgi:L-threonylcarbamoyladenylate synthase